MTEIWGLSFTVTRRAIVSDVNGDGANDLVIMANQPYVASIPADASAESIYASVWNSESFHLVAEPLLQYVGRHANPLS